MNRTILKPFVLAAGMSVAAILPAYAQSPLDEGVYSLSGSMAYSESDSDDEKRMSFSVSPQFMYFVAPGLAVGAGVLYQKSEYRHAEFETWGIGPTARYYLADEGYRPFVELRYFFEQVRGEATDPGYIAVDRDRQSISLALGAEIFISRNVALEPAFRYSHRETSYRGGVTVGDAIQDETAFSVGVSVFAY